MNKGTPGPTSRGIDPSGSAILTGTYDVASESSATQRWEPLADATDEVTVDLKINGALTHLKVDSRVTLLDALRERLRLTGTKKGCDHGQCGVCTVIMDGRRVLSCLTLVASCDGAAVMSIEGVALGEKLHPLQDAFIRHDAFQCGFCTPGQICSMIALLDEAKNGDASFVTADVRELVRSLNLSDDEIKERLSGNICRCGAYLHLIAAFREVMTAQIGADSIRSQNAIADDETV